jgi:glycine/sarcosine/betaine reductase complex component C subunit beta
MSRRTAGVLAASLTLQHVPDLVRYGSKPMRERRTLEEATDALRDVRAAAGYPPNAVFIGGARPEHLWDAARPWWGAREGARPGSSDDGAEHGPRLVGGHGEIIEQRAFYELLAEVDQFDLVRLKQEPRPGELPLYERGEAMGAIAPAHDVDEALSANVLLENLACKAGAVHALRHLLSTADVDRGGIEYVINAGEEAVGDRYQRGGGNLAKAVAEDCGLDNAGGSDVKAFCAGPIHALIMAGALVEAGVYEQVAVVAGGSVAKLGMKFLGAIESGAPILEDILASMAVVIGPAARGLPVLRMDAVGRHRVGAGSSQQRLLEDIVGAPLDAMGRRLDEIDVYATELHNPEITEPAGGGDVPGRNYRMLAGLGVVRGELERDDIEGFARAHGLPGFSPTQGHIASAVPWLPHALGRVRAGELETTMLLAKGSLFLGRMTRLWDGASIVLEAGG